MNIFLYWKDINGNVYKLGKLYREEKYYFEIYRDELKKATHNGCFGIGDFDLINDKYESDELFIFFKNRLPNDINKTMEVYDIEEYDDLIILSRTKGRKNTDRYYLDIE